ncbi:MAG: hypothetical protein M9907_06195 [Burkholderiaceae bacterium]|nr:hypothetical protein [Burkholderiaceae bacterium]
MKPIHEVERRWDSATVVGLRFGNTAELRKSTDEARRLADLADQARLTARKNLDFAKRARADVTLSDGDRMIREANFMKSGLQGLDGAFNRALEAATERAAALKAQLDEAAAPPSHIGKALVQAELRGRFAALDEQGRGQALRDPAVLAAVVAAPAIVSDLASGRWGELRREYWSKVAPDVLAQADDLQAAVDSAEQAVKSATAEAHDLVDFEAAEMLASRKVEA